MISRALLLLPLVLSGFLAPSPAPFAPAPLSGQERVYHPFYVPASHNWSFRAEFPAVDRLFNAFDYGHGILYETLWSRPDAPVSLLEEDIFHRLTREILPNPPRLPMPEASFMPQYARLVPLVKEMFEWAHILHRQSYDILADPSLDEEARDRAMEELLRHYRSSPLAFPAEPKGMEIMDEQFFSKAFRERYPRFNGLIWAYHWLQVAVYEPLLAHDRPEQRQAAVNGTLVRFWQMVEDPETTLPTEMPMSPAIAPLFTERYPEFAAIFDNLHMMHDVISDILVSEAVSRGDKRGEIYRQADLFRDPDAMAVSVEDWIAMALAHGVDAQGGPAIDWLPRVPTVDAQPGHHHPPDHGDHGAEEPPSDGHGGHDGHGDHGGHEGHEGHQDHDEHGDRDEQGGHTGHPMGHDHPMDHGMGHTGDHPHADHHGGDHDHHHAADHEASILEVMRTFHGALAAGDSARALELLHPEVRIHEQGVAETLAEYRDHHLAADIRFAAQVSRELLREEVVPGMGVMVYLSESRATGRVGEREIDARTVETAILVRTPEGWRIRHLHWSNR
jgi:hypothetical protein